MSIRKKERKGGSDEPDAPLLLEKELAVGEGDVVIGEEKRDQANNTGDDGFQQGFAVKPQAPPRADSKCVTGILAMAASMG